MTNILFVCTGNTCRSPLAEVLFLFKNNDDRFQVKSAGIQAIDGMPMSEGSKRALQKRGIEEEHTAQSVTEDLIRWADLILTMTFSHKKTLIKQYPQLVDKIFTLKEYVLDDKDIVAKLEQVNEHMAQIEIKRSTFLSKNKEKLEQHSKITKISERQKLEQELYKQLEPHYKAIDELSEQLPSFDITDPFGGSEEIYEETFKEIDEMIERLLNKINRENA